jgi:thiamine biosynthesis lipoprotein
MGIRNAMVDLGGNLRCRGEPRPGEPWKIGVRDPFDRERLIGVLRLTDGWAVATSGNYERFVTIAGKRYAHILDPRSGYPVEGMAGVTVLAPTATDADALSTTLFVLGPVKGRDVLARKPGCHALYVPDRQPMEIRVSAGFRKFFTPEPSFADHVRDWE